MKASLRTLLAGIIDYAGTFPPARLSLEETVRRYIEYRAGEHAWMLGNLVCAVESLSEVLFQLDSTLSTASLSVVASDSAADMQKLDSAMGAGLEPSHAGRWTCDFVEIKLSRADARILMAPSMDCRYFCELPASADWERQAESVMARLAEASSSPVAKNLSRFGFKLRTGGLDAAAFPSVERVAWVIAKCRDGGVPWKATAGLHHPLRHHDESIGVMMHGFLNVACAAVLAEAHRLDEAAIAEVLRDESIDSFEFRDDGLRWRNLEATNEQIAHCRRHGFLSFGSCSFEEPIEDLTALGLM